MLTFCKWCFAGMVLAGVVCVACCDVKCAKMLAVLIVEAGAVGAGYGLVVLTDLLIRVNDPSTITARRMFKLVAHDAKVGLVTGLLLSVTNALIALL